MTTAVPWLVLGGCGSAVLAAAFPELGIGFAGVALAFCLTVVTMAFAIGHISGCHLNPAVSFGLWAGGRFEGRDLVPYVVAQVIGAVAVAALALGGVFTSKAEAATATIEKITRTNVRKLRIQGIVAKNKRSSDYGNQS